MVKRPAAKPKTKALVKAEVVVHPSPSDIPLRLLKQNFAKFATENAPHVFSYLFYWLTDEKKCPYAESLVALAKFFAPMWEQEENNEQ